MHITFLRRIASLPFIREVLGAAIGGGVALALFGVFEIIRGFFGGGTSFDMTAPLHASAVAAVAHGTVSLGVTAIVALAGGCAFLHRRVMSDSFLRQAQDRLGSL